MCYFTTRCLYLVFFESNHFFFPYSSVNKSVFRCSVSPKKSLELPTKLPKVLHLSLPSSWEHWWAMFQPRGALQISGHESLPRKFGSQTSQNSGLLRPCTAPALVLEMTPERFKKQLCSTRKTYKHGTIYGIPLIQHPKIRSPGFCRPNLEELNAVNFSVGLEVKILPPEMKEKLEADVAAACFTVVGSLQPMNGWYVVYFTK